ncbi:14571_t:CDS:1, partial [Funneliformis caledonium]
VTSERRSSDNPSKKISKVVGSYMKSRPTTPSTAEPHTTSRPVTPTLPSFSQSANVINVTINYAGTDSKGIDSDE